MPLFDKVRDLPLTIDRYSLAPYAQHNPSGFTRLTTVIQLEGGDLVGRGEETSYSSPNQQSLQKAGVNLPLAGSYTLSSFSTLLDSLELWPDRPDQHAYIDYRRWAYESAALELALQQAKTTLAEALGRPFKPANFVVSTGLGSPPSLQRIEELLQFEPRLRFKLDTSNDWDDAFVASLAALDRVDVVDFKGAYVGTPGRPGRRRGTVPPRHRNAPERAPRRPPLNPRGHRTARKRLGSRQLGRDHPLGR